MTQRLYGLTENDRRKLRNLVQRVGAGVGRPSQRPAPRRRRIVPSGTKGITYVNKSGETIPPYAVMQVDDVFVDNGEYVVELVKPNGDVNAPVLFNRNESRENDQRWQAEREGFALYNTGDGTPEMGEGWGPKSGQWALAKDYPGFQALGDTDNGTGVFWHVPVVSLLGKADSTISTGQSGTVSIWVGEPGSEIDSDMDVEAFSRFGEVNNGAWVSLSLKNGHWYIDATQC